MWLNTLLSVVAEKLHNVTSMMTTEGKQQHGSVQGVEWTWVGELTFEESQCTLAGEIASCRPQWHGKVGTPPSSGTARSSAQGCVSMLADAASSGVPPLCWHVCACDVVSTLDNLGCRWCDARERERERDRACSGKRRQSHLNTCKAVETPAAAYRSGSCQHPSHRSMPLRHSQRPQPPPWWKPTHNR